MPWPYQTPFMPQGYNPYTQPTQTIPPTQVVRVNGRNGAEAYTIGPNSSALLLDESGALVWLVTTDGAGYKTVAPYDITPHKTAPSVDYSGLETRIARLEEIVNGNPSNSTATRRHTEPDDTAPVAAS